MNSLSGRTVASVIGLLVSIVAIAWLALHFDWHEFAASLRTAEWVFLVPVFPLILLDFALRTARWQALFVGNARPEFLAAFVALMLGYLFNNILPARAGELVRVHVVGRRGELSRSTALGTILVERTLELFVMLVMLAFVLIYQPLPGWTAHAGRVVVVLAFGAIFGFMLLGVTGERAIACIIPRLTFLPELVRRRLKVSAGAFIVGLSSSLHAPHVARFLMFSLGIWILEIAVAVLVSAAFNLPLSALDLVFVMIAVAIGTMVPSSPGYIGTFEFFGLNALALVGVSGNGALGFVVVWHTALLLGSSIVGVLCLAYIGWPTKLGEAYKRGSEELGR